MDWAKDYAAAVTICDREGTITYMNEQAAAMFAGSGGYDLIGKNLSGCHLKSSTEKVEEIIKTGKPNAYTTEKKGKKRLIYQAPHIENGQVAGIVELAIEIPFDMPHHVRS